MSENQRLFTNFRALVLKNIFNAASAAIFLNEMFEFQLFLGFPVDKLYAEELMKANPHVVAQFIQNEGDYLHEMTYQGMRFFGKFLGNIAELPQVELLEANIYSLLKKIIPHFPYHEVPLYLFPVEESHEPVQK